MVQLGIYVCAEYMYMCVYMHVCVRQKITSNVFLRHHPPLCLCVGTHMCAQVCVPMCVGVCAGASVCMWRPEVNFWCHLNHLSHCFFFFFVGFVLFLRQWSHHVALASHTMPSTRSREGGDKNPCPLR